MRQKTSGLLVRMSGRHGEALNSTEPSPAHLGVLGHNADDGFPVTAALCQRRDQAADAVSLVLGATEHGASAQDKQGTQVVITGISDVAQPGLAIRTVLTRNQTQLGGKLSAAPELMTVANHGQQRHEGDLANASESHELLGARVLADHLRKVPVVAGDAFVEMMKIAEQVTDDGISPARTRPQISRSLAAYGRSMMPPRIASRMLRPWNSCAQWCAPEQASTPITQGCHRPQRPSAWNAQRTQDGEVSFIR